MAKTYIDPISGIFVDDKDGKTLIDPIGGIAVMGEAPAAAGAIMNQLQGPNMGADLYNGTLL